MKEVLPSKLIAKMLRARKIANDLHSLIKEIDEKMIKIGYDVDRMRDEDSCGYVDMIDYGRGTFDVKEAQKYKVN